MLAFLWALLFAQHSPAPVTQYVRGTAPESVYVFGPESSGTRYVSRVVSRMLTSEQNDWNGEFPACFHGVQHISLPWGGVCDGALRVVRDVDLCSRRGPASNRWFANISSTLEKHPSARAIAITRNENDTLRSVMSHHCFMGKRVAEREHRLAMKLIDQVKSHPRVLHLKYEDIEWARVVEFLHIDNYDLEQIESFVNG